MAIAAAKNGNGSDTPARSHTKRAGMNGISHNSSRWKANSDDAAEITLVGDASGVGMISEQTNDGL
jgi:hypothetical protein